MDDSLGQPKHPWLSIYSLITIWIPCILLLHPWFLTNWLTNHPSCNFCLMVNNKCHLLYISTSRSCNTKEGCLMQDEVNDCNDNYKGWIWGMDEDNPIGLTWITPADSLVPDYTTTVVSALSSDRQRSIILPPGCYVRSISGWGYNYRIYPATSCSGQFKNLEAFRMKLGWSPSSMLWRE